MKCNIYLINLLFNLKNYKISNTQEYIIIIIKIVRIRHVSAKMPGCFNYKEKGIRSPNEQIISETVLMNKRKFYILLKGSLRSKSDRDQGVSS